tara:strand:- start:1189 stop:2205 length:1017 start_codon:yes stop_codon:yes gene_type:complete
MERKVDKKNIKEVTPVSLRQYYENENVKLPEFYRYLKTVEIKEFIQTSSYKYDTEYVKNNISTFDPDFQKTQKLAEKSLTERKKDLARLCIDLTSSLARNFLEKEYSWTPDMENPEKIFSSVLKIIITDKKQSPAESKTSANIIKIILLWLFFHRDFDLIDTFLLFDNQIQSISKSKTANMTLKRNALKYAIPRMSSVLNIKKLTIFVSAWMRIIDLMKKEKDSMLSEQIDYEDQIEDNYLKIEKLEKRLKFFEQENKNNKKEISKLEEKIQSAEIINQHTREELLDKQSSFLNNLKPLIDDAKTALTMNKDKPIIDTAIGRLDIIVEKINKKTEKNG